MINNMNPANTDTLRSIGWSEAHFLFPDASTALAKDSDYENSQIRPNSQVYSMTDNAVAEAKAREASGACPNSPPTLSYPRGRVNHMIDQLMIARGIASSPMHSSRSSPAPTLEAHGISGTPSRPSRRDNSDFRATRSEEGGLRLFVALEEPQDALSEASRAESDLRVRSSSLPTYNSRPGGLRLFVAPEKSEQFPIQESLTEHDSQARRSQSNTQTDPELDIPRMFSQPNLSPQGLPVSELPNGQWTDTPGHWTLAHLETWGIAIRRDGFRPSIAGGDQIGGYR